MQDYRTRGAFAAWRACVVLIAALAAIAFSAVTAGWARPSETITVCPTGCDYSTIEAAIDHASSGDEISIHAGVYYEHVRIDKDLTLTGAFPADVTRISGHGRAGRGDEGPLVTIAKGAKVRISDVEIRDGYNEDGRGGGILNEGVLLLVKGTVTKNHAVFGGGVDNRGLLDIISTTITKNSAGKFGGGIYNTDAVFLSETHITDNRAALGGGIYNAGSVSLSHTDITGNLPDNCAGRRVDGCIR